MNDVSNKVILTIAPTGNVPTKKLTHHVPLTPREIAADAYACWQEGAAVVHIHTRDKAGNPTSDIEVNREVMAELNKYPDCDIIRQLSTNGRAGKTYMERGQMLCLSPEMAGLVTGSSNFPAQCNFNDPETVSYLALEMLKYNVKPEIEVFDTAMIWNAIRLAEKAEIKTPMHFNLVLGMTGSQPATVEALMYCYQNLPKDCTWGVSVIGKSHVQLSSIAMALGGNVRVGIEDNIYYSRDTLATNVALVRRIKNIALAMGKKIATPAEARQILGLPPKNIKGYDDL
ncbi:MAG: 3-keto-5-aminohexanoate cleavage protein [Sporomusaceae bacterium]|nr:3-keto-5-aminohexanoate cleavage protein [Sporomusaceae bacterium]